MLRVIERIFDKYLPSPLALAVLLSLVAMILCYVLGDLSIDDMGRSWLTGMWQPPLLVFAVQMMLILVLGHSLVLSKPVRRGIDLLCKPITDQTSALIIVSTTTMLVAFFNWGLGLIFGAVMTRLVGEKARERSFDLNYGLLGAAGYSGLMIWHGGLSGSAPLKVAENDHLATLMQGYQASVNLPDLLPVNETIFSTENLFIFLVLLVAVPTTLVLMGKYASPDELPIPSSKEDTTGTTIHRMDAGLLSKFFGGLLLILLFWLEGRSMLQGIITPNRLNIVMLGLCLLFHESLFAFAKAVKSAITGATGILIQFPLYFGIMSIMRDSGLIDMLSAATVEIASRETLPILTFFSAGLVNIFVPSGGGQWAIQGPVILQSASQLNIPLSKAVMSLAYGDQLTNMLQPFWGLPLLGITGLKAKRLLPYTIILMLVGAGVFITGLILW
jgi:short-chain fatty acids transporter